MLSQELRGYNLLLIVSVVNNFLHCNPLCSVLSMLLPSILLGAPSSRLLASLLLYLLCMLHHEMPVDSKCIEGVYDKYPDCLYENNAIKPTPKIENDWYDWWDRHHTIVKHKKRINPEVVLIGDSITHRFGGFPEDVGTGKEAWDYLFQNRKVLNLGFGWDRTQNVLWRLYNGEYEGLKPAYVVLNIGTNNLTPSEKSKTRANSPYEIVEAIKLIVQIILDNSPGAKLIIMGIFPRSGKKYMVGFIC